MRKKVVHEEGDVRGGRLLTKKAIYEGEGDLWRRRRFVMRKVISEEEGNLGGGKLFVRKKAICKEED